jgi:hypothetical protein
MTHLVAECGWQIGKPRANYNLREHPDRGDPAKRVADKIAELFASR